MDLFNVLMDIFGSCGAFFIYGCVTGFVVHEKLEIRRQEPLDGVCQYVEDGKLLKPTYQIDRRVFFKKVHCRNIDKNRCKALSKPCPYA